MSVNQRHAIDQKKVQKFGKHFGSIDFEVGPISHAVLELNRQDTKAGKFLIGGKEFDCTLAELDRIIETCQTAKEVFFQKYRLGL
jgi:hypothetical protein